VMKRPVMVLWLLWELAMPYMTWLVAHRLLVPKFSGGIVRNWNRMLAEMSKLARNDNQYFGVMYCSVNEISIVEIYRHRSMRNNNQNIVNVTESE
jgi:hypothetical protein